MTYLWLPRHVRGPLLNAGAFSPAQISAVAAWLRLAASTQSGGEWTSVTDVLNPSNPATQTDVDRRYAVGTSANNLPTAVADGSDMLLWPLASNNNQQTKFGFACWVQFAAVAAADQILYAVFNAAGGANKRKIQTGIATSQIRTSVWADEISSTGRNINSAASTVPAATWKFFRLQYDSSVGGDGCVAHYLDEVLIAQSGNTNIGAGGTLGVMATATGNAVIGSQDDQDAPTRALVNNSIIGPNVYILNDNLTAAQGLALMNFERPT